jgi:hypothetical protein
MDSPTSPEWILPVEQWVEQSIKSEKSGDYLGACDAALLGLDQYPKARELQYRAVLNLSRAGAQRRAGQLLAQYRLQPQLDKIPVSQLERDIAALHARLERETAFICNTERRSAKLKKAAEHYKTLHSQIGGTFLGINAAVLYELSGDSAQAKQIASRILAECAEMEPENQEDAYQLAADQAAASLLIDDFSNARTMIERAAILATSASSIASTRKQLMQICDHKHIGADLVTALRNRTVIHYTGHMIAPFSATGRFPASAEARVANMIRTALSNCNVGYGYGSLACGADMLFVEALLDHNAEIDVVLPFETEFFLKESVTSASNRSGFSTPRMANIPETKVSRMPPDLLWV